MNHNRTVNYLKMNNLLLLQKNKIKIKHIKKLFYNASFIAKNKLVKYSELTHLAFGHKFNKPIKGYIPNNIGHFDVQSKFLGVASLLRRMHTEKFCIATSI